MSVGALVGVMDEVELIGPCIEHLRQIGVDEIVVTDLGSSDGTLDVLEAQRRAGDVRVVRVDSSAVPDYESWSAYQMTLVQRMSTEWVLFLDADEFWIPASGSLRDYRTEADVLVIERYNTPVTARNWTTDASDVFTDHDNLLLFALKVSYFREYLESHPNVPFILWMPGPKVMARRCVIQGVLPGGHGVSVLAADTPTSRISPHDVLIAHVAFSTADRFIRKVENIRAELARNSDCYSGRSAWHWKRWVTMAEVGLIEREFARQVLDDQALELMRRAGILRSAAELFGSRPVPWGVADYPRVHPVVRLGSPAAAPPGERLGLGATRSPMAPPRTLHGNKTQSWRQSDD